MKSNSQWQNRMGTIRVAALGVMMVILGVIWYVRHKPATLNWAESQAVLPRTDGFDHSVPLIAG